MLILLKIDIAAVKMDQHIAIGAAKRRGKRHLQSVNVFCNGEVVFALQGNGHKTTSGTADMITNDV